MNILLGLAAVYVLFCFAVTGYKIRHDPRYHYAGNSHPDRKPAAYGLVRIGDEMVSVPADELVTVPFERVPIRVRRHPRPSLPVLPDGVLNMLARYVGVLRWRRYAEAYFLVALGLGWWLWWTLDSASVSVATPDFSSVFTELDKARFWGWVVVIGPYLLSLATDFYMVLRIPSRCTAVKAVHHLWRFLTMRPNPLPDPTRARRIHNARIASERATAMEDQKYMASPSSQSPFTFLRK